MLVKFICSAHLSFLYAFLFLNKPCFQFLKPTLSKLKSLRCAKSISYGRINETGLCLVVTLQTSNPVNHLTQSEICFPTLAVRMSACRNTIVPISSSLCVLKRCKLLLFILVFFFLHVSHGPLTSTRKEIKYKFFVIILLHFRVRYAKTTKFLHLVHNEIR